jgi:protein-S-isoprenylcysteine O-methyltransferase Ste14
MPRNAFNQPNAASGATGGGQSTNIYAGGVFELEPDEALIIESRIPSRRSTSASTWETSGASRSTYANRHTSLNGFQVEPDADGVLRYVVAHRDPGVPNWLDTTGHREGFLTPRWAYSQQPPPDRWPTIRAQKVRFDEIRKHLPADTRTVSAPPSAPSGSACARSTCSGATGYSERAVSTVALILLVAYALVTIGWRAWLQKRRTGEAGLRAAPRARAEWIAGAALVCGAIAAYSAPLLDLAGTVASCAGLERPLIQIAGVTAFALGFWLTVRAQLDMGDSWRIGVETGEVTALVTSGLFRAVRNPIFTGMVLIAIGVALMVPNPVAFAGVALLALGLEIHVRCVEEPHLLAVHGDRYRSYAGSAGGSFRSWGDGEGTALRARTVAPARSDRARGRPRRAARVDLVRGAEQLLDRAREVREVARRARGDRFRGARAGRRRGEGRRRLARYRHRARDQPPAHRRFFDVEKFPTARACACTTRSRMQERARQTRANRAKFDLEIHGVKKTVDGEVEVTKTSRDPRVGGRASRETGVDFGIADP